MKYSDKQFNALLSKFKKVDGYDLNSYYGIATMVHKTSQKIQLRLQFDYKKHPINSEPYTIEINGYEKAVECLMERRRGKIESIDDIFSETTDEPIEEVVEELNINSTNKCEHKWNSPFGSAICEICGEAR